MEMWLPKLMYCTLLIFKHLRFNPTRFGKTLVDFQKEQNRSLKKEHCLHKPEAIVLSSILFRGSFIKGINSLAEIYFPYFEEGKKLIYLQHSYTILPSRKQPHAK